MARFPREDEAEMIRQKSNEGSKTAAWKKEKEAYQRLPLRLWEEIGEI